MKRAQLQSYAVPFFTFLIIIISSIAIIAYGRGYRIDITQQRVSTTGLLAITSDPTSAEVLIDEKLITVTNDTINLQPGWYDIRVVKEGYQPWQKRVRVQGEVVTRADVYFFPTTPSLSVISSNGALRPTLSPDATKLAYIIPRDESTRAFDGSEIDRSGIWVLNLVEGPLTLNRNARRIVASNITDFSESILTWSPDGKQLIAVVPHPISQIPQYYLLSTEREKQIPERVVDFQTLELEWDTQNELIQEQHMSNLEKDIYRVATSSATHLTFTPDESKVMYEATASTRLAKVISSPIVGSNFAEEQRELTIGNMYIYDIKEDRNYELGSAETFGFTDEELTLDIEFSTDLNPFVLDYYQRQKPLPLQWLSTSRHLVYKNENKIDMIEYDGSIQQTIYSGPFEEDFILPWTKANKLIILANFNPEVSPLPSLYSVNLR